MLRNLYFVVPVEVLLQPLEDVVAGEVGEDALVEVGAPASAQVTDVVDVHRNLPDSGKSLGRAKIIQFKYWSQSDKYSGLSGHLDKFLRTSATMGGQPRA